jgi:hypothetical protein
MSEFDQDLIEQEESGRSLNVFNVLTALLLLLTVAAIACFATIYFSPGVLPDFLRPEQGSLLPTAAPPPTVAATPTPVGLAELPSAWTATPTATLTGSPTPRNTPSITPTPSLTPTFNPTNTPTATNTPTSTPTSTPTPGPSPTPTNTRSPYPFTLDQNSPMYTANYANNAGCNWLGVAGQVFDLNGDPVAAGAYLVWVTENGVNEQRYTGSVLAYGPSGWEVYLFDRPRVQTHRIQLFSPSGTPVSEVYEFTTRASCNQNLVLVNFVQNH